MLPTGTTIIFETVTGSRAYNLHTAGSDVDLRGVVVCPTVCYQGFAAAPESFELSKDHLLYDVRKFFKLAVAGNPAALELLWIDPELHRTRKSAFEMAIRRRGEFLSKRVHQTFVGYAASQLRRIRSHRAWLLSPPTKDPARADFGLPERSLIPRNQLLAAEAMIRDGRIAEAELTPNFLDLMDRERRYRSARKHWNQYQTWLQTRNPARAQLEKQYGYDTKHAQHLVRLLRMGREVLQTGELVVHRPDREELLAIRDGALSYDELVELAERLTDDVNALAEASSLPAAPDEAALNELCSTIIDVTNGSSS